MVCVRVCVTLINNIIKLFKLVVTVALISSDGGACSFGGVCFDVVGFIVVIVVYVVVVVINHLMVCFIVVMACYQLVAVDLPSAVIVVVRQCFASFEGVGCSCYRSLGAFWPG